MTQSLRSSSLLSSLLLAMFGATPPIIAVPPCGTWDVASSPAPEDGSGLFGVDGIAPDDVWAVGYFDDKYDPFSADQHSLTLHWDGGSWTQVPSPTPGVYVGGGTDVYLYDVEMIASDDVWAGGTKKTQHSGDSFVGFQYFTLHWDGAEWTEIEAPETPIGGTGAQVYGLDSVATGGIWGVGSRVYPEVVGVDEVATALRWEGDRWREFVLPIVNEHQRLQRVRAFAPDDVWGAGGHGIEPADQVYVVRWDGDSWRLVDDVPEPGLQNFLFDIDGVSSEDLWVVGEINEGLGGTRALLFHYDGATWKEFDVVGLNAYQARVDALTVVASDDIWASGIYTEPDQITRLFILHWDGQEWRQVSSAPTGPAFGAFQSIVATGPCDAWSVGQSGNVTHTQRLLPDQLQTADLESAHVVRGRFVGGDLMSLVSSDDDRLEILGVEFRNRISAGVELVARSSELTPARLDVTLEWSLGRKGPDVLGIVRLFDRSTDQWVPIQRMPVPAEDETATWSSTVDLSRFVDPMSGEIRLQVLSRSRTGGPVVYKLDLDRVHVEVAR